MQKRWNRVYLDTSESFQNERNARHAGWNMRSLRRVINVHRANAGNVYITYRTVSQFKSSSSKLQRGWRNSTEEIAERSISRRQRWEIDLRYSSKPQREAYHCHKDNNITTATTRKKSIIKYSSSLWVKEVASWAVDFDSKANSSACLFIGVSCIPSPFAFGFPFSSCSYVTITITIHNSQSLRASLLSQSETTLTLLARR
jgi:hypothetical protein